MNKNKFAVNPPMGWNSWDCYGAAVTEKELRQNAEYMAKHLKKHGWEYIVCDIQWYEPMADSSHYSKFADLCMDEYGRLIPAVNRFPSAADGKGFTEIAAYIHELGLKFGIHIMRGIPRQAVSKNTPVKGTTYHARSITHPASICAWNTDMYGLDTTMPGAQEYYDSLMELYASWGVDFIKVDDICVKYGRINDESALAYGGDEIELLHRAIQHSGREIVLSLSPGPAMLDRAEHLCEHANMWRITNDFWDEWGAIMEMFMRCDHWSPYVSEGCFPDCDMLPIGHLSIKGCEHGLGERLTRFTKEEQRTMFTLWSIFRSPMMLGCELTDLDEWSLGLLKNDDVLGLLKNSRGAHQAVRVDDLIVWTAHDEQGHSYVAIFNTAGWTNTYAVYLDKLGLSGSFEVYDMWEQRTVDTVQEKLTATILSHDAKLYRLTSVR
ncbi:MAG: glycoside hydrolase family 27 protein [Lachnospiraceae bacterium]|nr:glycoside hydrolase family 27 protein [Lachnospiraceae bacterium]